MKISMKLAFQYMAIFFNFQTTSNHLHPLQVENCDSNSRLIVDEDDNGKLRLESVKGSFKVIEQTLFLSREDAYHEKWFVFNSMNMESNKLMLS